MTVKEKLIACALGGVFILVVLMAYGYLVVAGKAEAAPFLALLTSLVMAVVGLVSGLAGHAAGAGATDASSAPKALGQPLTLTIDTPAVTTSGQLSPVAAAPPASQ